MALLISSSEIQTCGECGCTCHGGGRRRFVYCYAGLEYLLEKDSTDPQGRCRADTEDIRGGHAVEVDLIDCFAGFGLRGGRLPICQEHRIPTDEDFP